MEKAYLYRLLSSLSLGVICLSVFAQHEFDLNAEYRPRAEVRSGYSQPLAKDLSPDLLMMQRVRLNAAYKSKLINARLSIQDSRVFGEVNQKGAAVNKDVKAPNLFLYEAWAELVFPKGIAFRIGRQALSYDDQRLLSVCNWNNTGSAHDLALLTYRFNGFKADLGYAYNNDQSNPLTSDYDYGTTSFYKTMAYLWLSQRFGHSGWNISAIAVSTGFQETIKDEEGVESYQNHYKYTYGGNVEFKKKDIPFSLYATAYGQSGETNKGIDLSAFMLALKLNYQIVKPLDITGGIDYFSGTSKDADKKKSNTFTGLYGTNHRFNGAMDYWTSTALPTGGLIDLYLSARYKVCDQVTLLGSFHSFRLAKEMEISSNKGLGNEIDLDVTYKFCKIATIQAGWSTYLTSDLTNVVRGVTGVASPTKDTDTRLAQWAYLSLTITPDLFTFKK